MILNPQLLQEILIQIQIKLPDEKYQMDSKELQILNYSKKEIGYHTALLVDAGLIETGEIFVDGQGIYSCNLQRLTWKGHQYLAKRINNGDTSWFD
jgi:hypothetical protein